MAAQTEYDEEERRRRPARRPRTCCRAAEAPIVPADSIAGRALVAVIAIMTFLAALTLGAVVLVRVGGGRMAVRGRARGDDPGAARPRARHRGGRAQGVGARAAHARRRGRARPTRKEESARLLEPWLGSGLALDELPVPRLIVVRIAPGADARSSRRCASSSPRRCRARRSTTIAAGSTACAPWRAARSSVGLARAGAGARRHRAVGDVRDARRHGEQPARSSRCCISSAPSEASSPANSSAISCCSA